MSFLAPALLLLAAAASVPLILHLLQRQQGKRVVFPALRYLRRAEREHARRIRFRQLLLLALRVSAIVLLALAAARPFLSGAGGEHRPSAVAIVLDNSASSAAVVGDRRVIDHLRERALETLEAGTPDDRFWLLRAAEPWEAAIPGSAGEVAERVRAAEPVAASADLAGSLARARALLEAGSGGRAPEIHLLTDLQASSAAGLADARGELPVLIWSLAEPPPPNVGVAAISIGGGIAPAAGQRSEVAVTLAGEGDSVAVRLVVGGRVVAAGLGQAGSALVLALPPQPEGLLEGRVEIDADALRIDDRRHFAARVRPPPLVALSGEAPFVRAALEALEGAGRIRLTEEAGAEIVVTPGAQGAERAGGRAIVVLPPASPLELAAANRRLVAAGIPWELALAAGTGESRIRAPEGDPELARLLERATVGQLYLLRPLAAARADAASSTVIRLVDGSPWAVTGEAAGGRRFVLLASPLDPSGGTLATSAAMAPLMDRVVGSWATGVSADGLDLRPGDAVELPPGASVLLAPDGTRIDVSGAERLRAPALAGVYTVLVDDEPASAFAVNPPGSESELRRIEGREAERALGRRARATGTPEEWRRTIYRSRRGSELWWAAALLALAALGAEMALAGSGGGAGRRGPVADPAPPREPAEVRRQPSGTS